MIALLLSVLFGVASTPATVLRVLDGDTFDSTAGRIRLKCLDAAELAQKPYGADARATLKLLLPVGSRVELRGKTSGGYGRIAAEVFRSGNNINLSMVARGQAFVYHKYLSGCDRSAYLRSESVAKQEKRGVWQLPNGIQRPWNFRQ